MLIKICFIIGGGSIMLIILSPIKITMGMKICVKTMMIGKQYTISFRHKLNRNHFFGIFRQKVAK